MNSVEHDNEWLNARIDTLEYTLTKAMFEIDHLKATIDDNIQQVNDQRYKIEEISSVLMDVITYDGFKEAVVTSNLSFGIESILYICNKIISMSSYAYNTSGNIGNSLLNWSIKLIHDEEPCDTDFIETISKIYDTVNAASSMSLLHYHYRMDNEVIDIINDLPLVDIYRYINDNGSCATLFLINLNAFNIYCLTKMCIENNNFVVLSKIFHVIYSYNRNYEEYVDTTNLLYEIVIDKNHPFNKKLVEKPSVLNIMKTISPRINNYYKLLNQ